MDYTFTQLLHLSQDAHAKRARMPQGGIAHIGSELGAWGSRQAALKVAISLIQEIPNQIPVTLDCPDLEF